LRHDAAEIAQLRCKDHGLALARQHVSNKAMRLTLYQPDIAQNTGTLMRLAACLDVPLDVIEPCGFAFSDRGLRRAGLDYRDQARLTRHSSWEAFEAFRAREAPGRLILLTTQAAEPYTRFAFAPDDILLLGRESAGVPGEVHSRADMRLHIPLKAGMRSINVALAGAMVLGEALRQIEGFPP
jgi:tRNA (cytidine/uridine-2'-O-)-methyltransferase